MGIDGWIGSRTYSLRIRIRLRDSGLRYRYVKSDSLIHNSVDTLLYISHVIIGLPDPRPEIIKKLVGNVMNFILELY